MGERVISLQGGCAAAVLLVAVFLPVAAAQTTTFRELFQPSWASDHLVDDGHLVKLQLNNSSGCGFASRNKYLFGSITVQIKLIAGDSAGTVTAFYMSSDGEAHDELDFEFLGNTSGQPYVLQTNVYVNGSGNREQRHYLWFDPTKEFHSYSILWNRHQVLFMVDKIPIRLFSNRETITKVSFPSNQPMSVYGSLWSADDWTTQGGRVKTNWTNAPFVSEFQEFSIDACQLSPESGDSSLLNCTDNASMFWWDQPAMSMLSARQVHQLKWVGRRYMIYDYCKDTARFAVKPPEC